jgi:hypothetical protein
LCAWYFIADYGDRFGAGRAVDISSNMVNFVAWKGYTVAKHCPCQNIVSDPVSQIQSLPSLFWSGVAVSLLFAAILCFRGSARGQAVGGSYRPTCSNCGCFRLPCPVRLLPPSGIPRGDQSC